MKKFLFWFLLLLALGGVGILVYNQQQQSNPDYEALGPMGLFGLYIMIGLSGGFLVVSHVLPSAGDWIGNLFFSSNEEIREDPASAARAKLAQGDYEGAVEEFLKLSESDPSDPGLVWEAARTMARELENPDGGANLIYDVLEQREWQPEPRAFLLFRLSELHANERQDVASARAVLEAVLSEYEGTRHGANAKHQLKLLEQKWGQEEIPSSE